MDQRRYVLLDFATIPDRGRLVALALTLDWDSGQFRIDEPLPSSPHPYDGIPRYVVPDWRYIRQIWDALVDGRMDMDELRERWANSGRM